MKKNWTFLYITLCLSVGLLACKSKQEIAKANRTNVDPQEVETNRAIPKMTFDKVLHDFGKVKKGEKKEVTFHYTNTGEADLEIEIVTSCNCTTLDYSIEPLPPGGKDSIRLVFDSSEKDESETIDVTIILKNINPENGYPIVEEVKYKFELVQ